ncbi:Arc family DNA-binding protein [Metapseudomonas furukawaii]|uniref:Arc family DNA-binding protein n=1 Tax=Metapseudomonas furukawaii TaxID=1149133 RepID=UPI00404641AA
MDDIYRSQFRLPYPLYEQLKQAADDNRRSVNAELVARLTESFGSTLSAERAPSAGTGELSKLSGLLRAAAAQYDRHALLMRNVGALRTEIAALDERFSVLSEAIHSPSATANDILERQEVEVRRHRMRLELSALEKEIAQTEHLLRQMHAPDD